MTTSDPEPDYQHLAEVVRQSRTRDGLSQQDVAARGGPSDTTLSQIEAGTWRSARPGPTLRKLDKGLGWATGAASDVAYYRVQLDSVPRRTAAWPTGLEAGSVRDPIYAARLTAFKDAAPSTLSAEQLEQQIRTLEQYTAELGAHIEALDTSLREARGHHAEASIVLQRAEQERDFRRHEDDVPEVPDAVLSANAMLSLISGALVATDIRLPGRDPRPDLVAITPDGRTLILEISREGTADSLRARADSLRAAIRSAGGSDLTRRVYGVVVDARSVDAADLVDRVLSTVLETSADDDEVAESDLAQERAYDAWRESEEADPYADELAPAARNPGAEPRGSRNKRQAEAAGEPETDDPTDLEPR